jgi:hypothetical protein
MNEEEFVENLIDEETKKNSNIIKLSFKFLGKEKIKIFCNKISNLSTIKYLDLMCNNIKDEGCIYISNFLKTNDTINYLNISCNDIGPLGAKSLANLFSNKYDKEEKNFTLEHLGYFN